MKKKTNIFDIYSETYGVNLTCIIGMKYEKIRSYLEKKYKISWDYQDFSGAGAIFTFNKWPYHVLWLKNLNKSDFLPKLSHEVFHHVLRVCKDKNIPTYPHIDNLVMDEAAAYLMEFYMREILKKI